MNINWWLHLWYSHCANCPHRQAVWPQSSTCYKIIVYQLTGFISKLHWLSCHHCQILHIKRTVVKTMSENVHSINLAKPRDQWWAHVSMVINFWVLYMVGNFFTSWMTTSVSRRSVLPGVWYEVWDTIQFDSQVRKHITMCNFISEEYLKNVTWPLHYMAVNLLLSDLFNTDFTGSRCTHGSNINL